MMENKKGFIQISFTWLFAIVIGGIILFGAIYASVKLIKTEETVSSTETGKEIAVLLNPLETGFGAERTTQLSLPVESKINNICDSFAGFGEQEITVSQQKGDDFTDTGVGSVVYNKYIFSNESVEGRNFYLFSKPFEFPFKVADLIFLTSSKEVYCFEDAPKNIQDELTSLNQANLLIGNCPSNSINVCFDGEDSECEIIVDISDRSIDKGEGLVYFETDSLMYGAIFSEKDVYECQVQRLMARLTELTFIYNEKQNILSENSCSADVSLLLTLAEEASSLEDSSTLFQVKALADDVEDENKRAECELW